MPDLDRKEKVLILSGIILLSSFVIYKTYTYRQKSNKKRKYEHWEAILVDSGIL